MAREELEKTRIVEKTDSKEVVVCDSCSDIIGDSADEDTEYYVAIINPEINESVTFDTAKFKHETLWRPHQGISGLHDEWNRGIEVIYNTGEEREYTTHTGEERAYAYIGEAARKATEANYSIEGTKLEMCRDCAFDVGVGITEPIRPEPDEFTDMSEEKPEKGDITSSKEYVIDTADLSVVLSFAIIMLMLLVSYLYVSWTGLLAVVALLGWIAFCERVTGE